jgi:phospholipid/cholesterol/gamma-HCH transport system substrate-binding protein
MKRTGANDFIVGSTMLVAAVLLVSGTMWLGQMDVGQRRARVEARFGDVGNAQVGNAVVIRGVKSGRIESIELADGGWVRVGIGLDPEITLPRDPVVLVGASSLFGDWQATILEQTAAPDSREVREQLSRASGKRGMLPGAVLPDVAHLTTVAGDIADNVATFAERVRVAFDDSAAAELRSSFRNVAKLSAELAQTTRVQSKNLDEITRDVRLGASELTETARALRRTVARVDSSTSAGEVALIMADIQLAASTLRDAAGDLHSVTSRLDGTQATLDSLLGRSASVMAKIDSGDGSLSRMLNDGGLYTGTDSLVREMRALVADVRARPKRYINLRLF